MFTTEVNGTFVITPWTAVGSKYIPPFKVLSYFFCGNKMFLSKSASDAAVCGSMFRISPLMPPISVWIEVRSAEFADAVAMGTYIGVPYLV